MILAIFIVGFKHWNIELYMFRIWFSGRPVLVYSGESSSLLVREPSQHSNPDKMEMAVTTWEIFRNDIEKYHLSGADFDVYILDSLYKPEYGEIRSAERIDEGFFDTYESLIIPLLGV